MAKLKIMTGHYRQHPLASLLLLFLSYFTICILGSPVQMSDHKGLRLLVTGSFDSGLITGHSYNPKTRQFIHKWTTSQSSPGPSWQYYVPSSQLFYSVNEGLSTKQGGSIDVYRILDRGFEGIEKIGNASSVYEPVSIDIRGNLLVSASYRASGINSYTVDLHPNTHSNKPPITLQQQITYTLPPPGHGPNIARQDSSHPHQANFDPTGKFIIIPDLGADLLRLYSVDHEKNKISSFTDESVFGQNPPGDVKVKGGFGPRHGAFWPYLGEGKIHDIEIEKHPQIPKYLYLVGELMSEIIVYSVCYGKASNGKEIIQFKEEQTISTFGKPENNQSPNALAAEVVISPDQRFLYVSNRGDRSFKPDPKDPSKDMDSIALFSIDKETGLLTFVKLTPSGGFGPRHFAISEWEDSSEGSDGKFDYVTVANQISTNVVVYRRDKSSGVIEEEIWAEMGKEAGLGVGPTCVTWL